MGRSAMARAQKSDPPWARTQNTKTLQPYEVFVRVRLKGTRLPTYQVSFTFDQETFTQLLRLCDVELALPTFSLWVSVVVVTDFDDTEGPGRSSRTSLLVRRGQRARRKGCRTWEML